MSLVKCITQVGKKNVLWSFSPSVLRRYLLAATKIDLKPQRQQMAVKTEENIIERIGPGESATAACDPS